MMAINWLLSLVWSSLLGGVGPGRAAGSSVIGSACWPDSVANLTLLINYAAAEIDFKAFRLKGFFVNSGLLDAGRVYSKKF